MSKSLIKKIETTIQKLDEKIADLTNERDRCKEMLALIQPRNESPLAVSQASEAVTQPEGENSPAPLPKEGDTGTTTLEEIFKNHTGTKVPKFLGKKHHEKDTAA